MTPRAAAEIPLGDVELYDRCRPGIEAGEYVLSVSHVLDGVNTGDLGLTQQLTVSAPQFTMPQADVVQLYPPDGGAGRFAHVFPFVLLAEPLLPWERAMPGTE